MVVLARTAARASTLAIVAAALLLGCPGHLEMHSTWPGGSLSVLRGASDQRRERMGLWVYYSPDGAVEYERTYPDGRVFIATGVYENGQRIRLPTQDELDWARAEADRIERTITKRNR